MAGIVAKIGFIVIPGAGGGYQGFPGFEGFVFNH
jgi:hypothetical protein